MKIDGIPGEYYSHCLFTSITEGCHGVVFRRELCTCWHESKIEAEGKHGKSLWPVEIMDGIAYVPGEEELR